MFGSHLVIVKTGKWENTDRRP